MFNGLDKRIAILEATVGFLKDRLVAIEAMIVSNAAEVTRKVDKVETKLGEQDSRLDAMHNQNQNWIRSVAYGVILLLVYALWSALHLTGPVKLP